MSPVIVVSNRKFNEHSEDILVVGITSNISRENYAVNLTNRELEEGNLLTQCCIKVENILKIDKGLIIKKIGRIKQDKLQEIINKLFEIVN